MDAIADYFDQILSIVAFFATLIGILILLLSPFLLIAYMIFRFLRNLFWGKSDQTTRKENIQNKKQPIPKSPLKYRIDKEQSKDIIHSTPETMSSSEQLVEDEKISDKEVSKGNLTPTIPNQQLEEDKPTIEPENSSQKEIKYIGYTPSNIFLQSGPLSYPYVIMPNPDCVIKFPQRGRNGRKGYTESTFYSIVQQYFRNTFQLYDDRYVLTKNTKYEPDITFINEKNGINIFMDIEIDEPYEGINDINKRQALHYQYVDAYRNDDFKYRGWIVVRFAEIQVHQYPLECCKFIADVIKGIYPEFEYPISLSSVSSLIPVQQWTKETALQWSQQKYREQYLGIERFGVLPETKGESMALIQDAETEKLVKEEKRIVPVGKNQYDNITNAIHANKYLTFNYRGERTIIKPIQRNDIEVRGYCYVKNQERTFTIVDMSDVCLKDNYWKLRKTSDQLSTEVIADIMEIVISNHDYIRMEYTRRDWLSGIDPTTGEILMTKAETSIRTISNIKLDTKGYGSNYIRAYCHKREANERIFKFDRISLLEVLDIVVGCSC